MSRFGGDRAGARVLKRRVLPTRFLPVAGSLRAAKLGPFLTRVDPLADDLVQSLDGLAKPKQEERITQLFSPAPGAMEPAQRRLYDSLRAVPFWLEPERANLGSKAG